MLDFEKFPKIQRIKDGLHITVTEKIDGTNGQIIIPVAVSGGPVGPEDILIGSRTRFITPGKHTDNYGFARWVTEHAEDLLLLGHGRHYGEWYGRGIQRGYGLDDKFFALFNTSKPTEYLPSCLETVPVLYKGLYQGQDHLLTIWEDLVKTGSHVHNDCGFDRPEGLVIYFHEHRSYLKMPVWK